MVGKLEDRFSHDLAQIDYVGINTCIFILAPIALANHKIGSGKTVTSHPSVKDKLVDGEFEFYLVELLHVHDKINNIIIS